MRQQEGLPSSVPNWGSGWLWLAALHDMPLVGDRFSQNLSCASLSPGPSSHLCTLYPARPHYPARTASEEGEAAFSPCAPSPTWSMQVGQIGWPHGLMVATAIRNLNS